MEDDELTFTINKDFADKYEKAKRGQELSGSKSYAISLCFFVPQKKGTS